MFNSIVRLHNRRVTKCTLKKQHLPVVTLNKVNHESYRHTPTLVARQKINAAVDGHNSRLEYLESNMTHAKHLEERIKSLELRCATLSDRLQAIEAQATAVPFIQLYERLQNLEKAYPDMATTKDLLKETDPAVVVDKMHSFLDRELNLKLQAYVRRCDIEEDMRAILEGLALSIRIKRVE